MNLCLYVCARTRGLWLQSMRLLPNWGRYLTLLVGSVCVLRTWCLEDVCRFIKGIRDVQLALLEQSVSNRFLSRVRVTKERLN